MTISLFVYCIFEKTRTRHQRLSVSLNADTPPSPLPHVLLFSFFQTNQIKLYFVQHILFFLSFHGIHCLLISVIFSIILHSQSLLSLPSHHFSASPKPNLPALQHRCLSLLKNNDHESTQFSSISFRFSYQNCLNMFIDRQLNASNHRPLKAINKGWRQERAARTSSEFKRSFVVQE